MRFDCDIASGRVLSTPPNPQSSDPRLSQPCYVPQASSALVSCSITSLSLPYIPIRPHLANTCHPSLELSSFSKSIDLRVNQASSSTMICYQCPLNSGYGKIGILSRSGWYVDTLARLRSRSRRPTSPLPSLLMECLLIFVIVMCMNRPTHSISTPS